MAIVNKTKKKIILKIGILAGVFLFFITRLFGLHSFGDFKKIFAVGKTVGILVAKADIPGGSDYGSLGSGDNNGFGAGSDPSSAPGDVGGLSSGSPSCGSPGVGGSCSPGAS